MKALFTLNSLSEEEKNLLKVKQITDERTPDEWLALFTKLRDFDKQGDTTRWFGGGIGCLGIVLIVVGIILLGAYIGFLILPLGIILAIAGFIIYLYIKPYDIQSEVLTHTVIPILMVLREEMKPREKLKLRLDLRGFEQPEKLLRQSPDYGGRGAYRSIIDYFYRDHWMDGEATLADNTKLIWSVYDLVRHIKKVKYRKGKRKSKSKHRTLISMQIGMNKKHYALPPLKQKGQEGAIRTKKTDDYVWMQVRKTIKHPAGQTFKPHDFINAIASAYMRATPQGGKSR